MVINNEVSQQVFILELSKGQQHRNSGVWRHTIEKHTFFFPPPFVHIISHHCCTHRAPKKMFEDKPTEDSPGNYSSPFQAFVLVLLSVCVCVGQRVCSAFIHGVLCTYREQIVAMQNDQPFVCVSVLCVCVCLLPQMYMYMYVYVCVCVCVCAH